MGTQIVPVYSQEEQRILRLNTCKGCIYSQCNGNSSNKCNIDSLVCSIDNKGIVVKSNNLSNKCAKGYWDNTNMTKSVFVPNKGCGCGK